MLEREGSIGAESKSIEDHLKTVNRLYETQINYDEKLEANKFLYSQNEINSNKQKPTINSISNSLLLKNKDWKPIYIRTPDVIDKTNRDIELLRNKINNERLK